MKAQHYWIILSLIILFASCSQKDASLNCTYLPEVVDNKNILTSKTHTFFKNYEYPLGIVPVLYATDSIPALRVSSFSDEVFDSIASNHPDKKAFKKRGLLVIVSLKPELIQVRMGNVYNAYCRMQGATSGHNYVTLQKMIPQEGIDNSIPLFVDNTISTVVDYRNLPWLQKKRIRVGLGFISHFLEGLGSPSENFFDQVYFTPFVKLMAFLNYLVRSWFLSFFIIVSLFYAGIVYLKRRMQLNGITNFFSKENIGVISLRLFGVLICFPSIAAVTILSNARLEDKYVLEAAHIPFLECIDWTSGESMVTPPIWLILLIVLVLYFCRMTLYTGILSLSLLPDVRQVKYYNYNSETTEGYKATIIKFLHGGSLRASAIHLICQNLTSNTEYSDNTSEELDSTMSNQLNLLFFITENDKQFKETPYSAVQTNLHREGIIFCLLLLIAGSLFFTTVIAYFALAIWGWKLISQLIAEYYVYKEFTQYVKINNTKHIIRELAYFCLFISLGTLLMVFFNPLQDTDLKQEISSNMIDQTILPGLYSVSDLAIEDGNRVGTARIVDNGNGDFSMSVYSDSPTCIYQLRYNDAAYEFQSDQLGTGCITFNKETNRITIKFEKQWKLVK